MPHSEALFIVSSDHTVWCYRNWLNMYMYIIDYTAKAFDYMYLVFRDKSVVQEVGRGGLGTKLPGNRVEGNE